jgi:hypothetical protein
MREQQYRAVVEGQQGPWRGSLRAATGDLVEMTGGAEVGVIESTWAYQDKRSEPTVECDAIELMCRASVNGWLDGEGKWVSITDPPAHKTKLWLDDVAYPKDWYYQSKEERQAGPWVWVQTMDEVIEALSSGRYDEVSLDYYLEETDPAHCGLDVAKWILNAAEAGTLKRLDLHAHSNHSGRRREMYTYFKAAAMSWKAKEKA